METKFMDWTISSEKSENGNIYQFGHVWNFYLDNNRQSASLECAAENGVDSTFDEAIPKKVIDFALHWADRVDKEGGWVEAYGE